MRVPLDDAPEIGDVHTELLGQVVRGRGWAAGWLDLTLTATPRTSVRAGPWHIHLRWSASAHAKRWEVALA